MNAPVMISVLAGNRRDEWVNPYLMQAVLAATQDSRHQRGVGVDVTIDVKPVAHARNATVAKFLQSGCGWLCMIDNDQFPRFPILDLIKAAEDAGKSIVSVPTPILTKNGTVAWNVENPEAKAWYQQLPAGWFCVNRAGAGMLCVRRSVFDKLPHPWFSGVYEDLAFCEHAAAHGFKVWSNSNYCSSHLWTVDMFGLVPPPQGGN